MPKRVQRLGHPSAQAQQFLGLSREITVDTSSNTLRVHDGINKGGFPLAKADLTNSPVASSNNDGKMSIALFNELAAATAKNAVQDGRLTALETFRNYFPNIDGVVNASVNDMNLLTGKYVANQFFMRGKGASSGDATVLFMYNASAASGWISKVLDTEIRALFVDNNQTAATGGQDNPTDHDETVNITIAFPASTQGHRLTAAQSGMPQHTHLGRGVRDGQSSGIIALVTAQAHNVLEDASHNVKAASAQDASQTHAHDIGGQGTDSDNVRFRPRYAKGHLYEFQN